MSEELTTEVSECDIEPRIVSKEWYTFESDRGSMCCRAVDLVSWMVTRKNSNSDSSTYTEVELTRQEENAYNAALLFLEKQFDSGALPAESHLKAIEEEVNS